jgi:hypothetical protein
MVFCIQLLGHLLVVAKNLAEKQNLSDGYRIGNYILLVAVKPLNKGHLGDFEIIRCSEVSLIWR